MSYLVLRFQSIADLMKEVQRCQKIGWTCQGGVSYEPAIVSYQSGHYLQAMVLKVDKSE